MKRFFVVMSVLLILCLIALIVLCSVALYNYTHPRVVEAYCVGENHIKAIQIHSGNQYFYVQQAWAYSDGVTKTSNYQEIRTLRSNEIEIYLIFE